MLIDDLQFEEDQAKELTQALDAILWLRGPQDGLNSRSDVLRRAVERFLRDVANSRSAELARQCAWRFNLPGNEHLAKLLGISSPATSQPNIPYKKSLKDSRNSQPSASEQVSPDGGSEATKEAHHHPAGRPSGCQIIETPLEAMQAGKSE